MPKTLGLEQALQNLNAKIQKAVKDADVEVVVGYSAPYALIVHEDLEAHHDNGQAKFLEQPARVNATTYGKRIAAEVKSKKTMRQALMTGATQLKRDSQALCPVDTGVLKASAYVKVDTGAAAKAARIRKGNKQSGKRKTQHR